MEEIDASASVASSAAGDPAQSLSSDRHDELWAVQEPLDFPGTVYGGPRGTSMREIMRRQSRLYGDLPSPPAPASWSFARLPVLPTERRAGS